MPRLADWFQRRLTLTRRALLWWLVPVAVIAALFIFEWVRHSMTVAFELLTGTVSVSQVHAGPAGWCLLFAGYLVLPVAIAVLASAVFASQVHTLSQIELEENFDSNYERVFGEKPPPRTRP